MRKDYDIFISYRREGGKEYARNLTSELVSRGFHPFLDFDELKDGKFDKRITDAIESAPVFMFILSPGSLDRCVNEDDWVRKEILHAIEHKRHFVPVDIDKQFDAFPTDESFPQAIKDALGQHQFSQIQTETLYKVSIDEMVKNRIQPAIDEYMREKQKAAGMAGAEIHIETDMDCHVQRFHKDMIVAKVDEENVIHLPKGKHKLQFIAVENPDIKDSCEYKVEDVTESDFIEVFLKEKVDVTAINKEELERLQQRLNDTQQALDKANMALKAYEDREECERKAREEETRRKAEEEKKRRITKVGNVEFKMIRVEGGTFMMGATPEMKKPDSSEMPIHQVTLSSYYIAETPVTQALWEEVMGNNPSSFKGDNNPVESVSWKDCHAFIKKLNQKTGKKFRMLTEAEWEYAARGGNNSMHYTYSGSNSLDEVAWYEANSYKKGSSSSDDGTHPVKTKKPNELGIYDMSGNVWEWCQDWYGSYSSTDQIDPTGPANGSFRVYRGGSWSYGAKSCRLSSRGYFSSDGSYNFLGFRLALSE